MKRTALWILAIAMIVFGCIMLANSKTDSSGDAQNLEKLGYLSIKNDAIYYVDELVILDQVGALEDSSTMYLMVMFQDADGKHIVANMPVNQDDEEIYEDVCDYLGDPAQGIGDLVISAYVKTEDFVDVEGELKGYFDQGVRDYMLYTGDYVISMSHQLEYLCDEGGDPFEKVSGAYTVSKVVGVLCIVGALLSILASFAKPKAKQVQPLQTAPSVPQSGSASANPEAGKDVRQQLDYYKSLHDAGYMTDAEFEAKRKQILNL